MRTSAAGLVSAGGVACAALVMSACSASEPTVVVYVSGDPDVAEWIAQEFRAAHPEEHARVEQLTGSAVLERLRTERVSVVADVWVGAPTWHMAEAAKEGLLAETFPTWAGVVPDSMRDPRGRWIGWVADPMVLAFNAERTSRGRAPRDWIDVFHPRWVEDVLLADATNTPTMEAFIGTVVARMTTEAGDDDPGFDWLARLDANRKEYVRGSDEVVRRLSGGESSLALLSLSQAQAAREGGRPVDFRLPESGSPTLVRGVAAVAGSPHPDGATTFIDWLGSPAARTAATRRLLVLPATSEAVEGEPAWVTALRPRLRMEVAPADTLAAHLGGWLTRWREEVMGRTPLVY